MRLIVLSPLLARYLIDDLTLLNTYVMKLIQNIDTKLFGSILRHD